MGKLVKYDVKSLKSLEDKAIAIKKKQEEDNRSVGQVARDVHLTNTGLKKRSFDEQQADRDFLFSCLECWDLLGVEHGVRDTSRRMLVP
jgi:hypothetical protein